MKTKLLELIDFKKVNTLLEGFNKTTGFVTAIFDLEGNVLSKSGWRHICTEFHRIHPETSEKCRISDTELANKMVEGEKYHFYKCLNGLVDVAVPLVINGEHIANLLSGQFFFEKPDKSFFQEQAEMYGFDDKTYLEALDKVPVVSEENVKTAMDFLLNMTQLIGEMTLQKLEQTELNSKLEQKEDRLSKIVLAANDGMWDWDLRTNQVYFDPRYFQMSGYDVDEFPHRLDEFQKRVHPDDVDYVMNEAEKHIKGEIDRFSVKFRFREKSGNCQWIHGKGKIVDWDEKGVPQRFIGTHRDISELNQVEEELISNYALLHIAGETARFGGWSVDLEKNICTWSDAVADIHGMPHGYAPPVQEGVNFYAPEWREKITQVFTDCATKGIPYDEEMEIITSKGKHLWVRTIGRALKDEKGKIIKVHGSFQDVTDRKQVEEALRESEEKMRSIYSVAPAGIGVITNRVLKEVNPRICEMTGYSREELLGQNARILYPSQEEYEFVGREKYSQIREKGTGEVETRWQKKDGTIINILLASTPIYQNYYTKDVIFTALDITDRKQVEEELSKRESVMRALLDGIPESAFLIDLYGNVIAANTTVAQRLNKKDNELIGSNIFKTVPEEVAEFRRNYLDMAIKTGNQVQFQDVRFNRIIDNRINPIFDRDGKISSLAIIGIDITDRKRAEEALISRENLLNKVFEILPIGLWFADKEGKLIRGNPAGVKIWGAEPNVSMEEYGVFKARHLLSGKEIEPDDWALAHTIREGITIVDELLEIDTFDGQKKIILNYTAPVLDDDGNIQGAIVVNQDITGRKRAEEALKESEERFKKLSSFTFEGIVIHNNAIAIDVNQSFVEMFGYDKDEIIGMNLFSLIHPDYHAKIRENLSKQVAPPYHVIGIKKNGSIFDVEIEARNISYNNEFFRVSCIRDITERKRAEEQIMSNESRMQSLIRIIQHQSENVQELLDYALEEAIQLTESRIGYIYFYSEEKKEFLLNTWSEGVMDVCGITEPHTIYQLEKTGIWGEAVRQRKEIIINDFQAQHPLKKGYPQEHALLYKYLTVPVFKRDEIVAVVGLANKETDYDRNDVLQLQLLMDGVWKEVEAKRAEEIMRENEDKFKTIINQAPEALFLHKIDGSIVDYNQITLKKYGYSADEIIQLKASDIDPDYEEREDHGLFWKELNQKKQLQFEAKHKKKDGTIFPVEVSVASIILKDESFYVALANDITDRKQSEEALKQSEHNFKKLYDDAPVCYHEINTEGRITRVNKTETALLGYSKEEMIGKHFWEFLVKDQREMSKKAIIEKISTKNVSEGFERDIVCKGGGILTFFIRDSIVLDTNGKATGIRSTLENITERKRAEKLKQVQYKIANAVITSKNLSKLFDSIKNELNSMIDANNIFIALYNEETGMLFSPHFKDKNDIREWPAERSLTGYLIRQNRPLLLRKQEIKQLHAEGLIDLIGTIAEVWLGVPLKVEGKMLGAVVVQNYDNPDVYDQSSIEILELVAREMSIFIDWQRSEEKASKLAKAVEQSSVSVMITNRDGIIEYVNSFFTKLTGYRFEEVKGKNPNILKSGHQSKAFYKVFWDTILSGNDWEGEFLNKKKTGELYWANAVVSPIVNSDGIITNFISIKDDITERKKMFEELLAAKEKAEESDKLKTAFLNNISHEIRTPLNGILGFGSFLSETDLSPEAKKEMLAVVQKSSDRLMNTVENYMDMALIFSGAMQVNKKEFILKPIFDDVIKKTRQLCTAKQLNFEVVSPPEYLGLTLDSDPELIKKMLNLLLDNALKFTSKGCIACGYNLKNGFIEFFVKDTGKGIGPQKINAIFNLFTQEDSSDTRGYEGSGLGLSIVRGMVKLLGGTISVQSQPGEGSVFTFTVPYKKMVVAEKVPPAREKNRSVSEKPLVLLAEDEESNYLYEEVVLKMAGCDYLLAKNGAEAVAFCKKRPDINLVLMDIKMPVMDGLEATRLIREFRPDLTIIATTAYAQTGDEHRFLASGCDGYLAKPIRKEELLAVLNKYSLINLKETRVH